MSNLYIYIIDKGKRHCSYVYTSYVQLSFREQYSVSFIHLTQTYVS